MRAERLTWVGAGGCVGVRAREGHREPGSFALYSASHHHPFPLLLSWGQGPAAAGQHCGPRTWNTSLLLTRTLPRFPQRLGALFCSQGE